MKNLFGKDALRQTVSSLSDGAARFSQSTSSLWRNEGSAGAHGRGASQDKAAGAGGEAKHSTQYLRLPLDSARKLKWYDQKDLRQLVRQHVQEKMQLLHTIDVLKEALLQRGASEEELEGSLQGALEEAQRLEEQGRAENGVLLLAAQAELEQLQEAEAALQARLQQVTARLQLVTQGSGDAGCLDAPSPASSPTPQLPARSRAVAVSLQLPPATASDNAPDRNPGDAATACQPDGASPSAVVKLLLTVLPDAAADPPQGPPADGQLQQLSAAVEDVLEKLQRRAESEVAAAPRRTLAPGSSCSSSSDTESAAGYQEASPASSGDGNLRNSLRHLLDQVRGLQLTDGLQWPSNGSSGVQEPSNSQQMAALQRRCEEMRIQVTEGRRELEAVREAAKRQLADAQARAGSSTLQQDMLQKARSVALEAQQETAAAMRRCERAEARVGKLEAEAKDSRKRTQALEKSVQRLERIKDELSSRAVAAEAAAGEAAQSGVDADREGEVLRQQLQAGIEQLEEKLSVSRMELEAQKRNIRMLAGENAALEARLREAEAREVNRTAEADEVEALVAHREQLALRVLALEQRLEAENAEQLSLQHYKQVAKELEEGKVRMEAEVMTAAGLVRHMEERLRRAQQEAEDARLQSGRAEQAAQQAEANARQELARRMEAAGTNRDLWPARAVQEVEQLQERLDIFSGMVAGLQTDLDAEVARREAETQLRTQAEASAQKLRAAAAEAELQLRRQAHEQQALQNDLQHQLSAAQQQSNQLSAENDRLSKQLFCHPRNRDGPGPGTPHLASRGGGSLHDAAPTSSPRYADARAPPSPVATAVAAAAAGVATTSGPGGEAGPVAGVDLIYLRNVLLKFVEAHASGRIAQRDALLPVISTLLHASPEEFRELRASVARSATGTAALHTMGSLFGNGIAKGR